MRYFSCEAWLDTMLEEATLAKAEGNRLHGAGEFHSAIAAYTRINDGNPRINDRSFLRLPDSFTPGEFMDDFVRSPMWSRDEVCLAPNVAPLIKIVGQQHKG